MDLFREEVLRVVAGISAGHTMSYKEVALVAGRPGAQRAVGAILRTNYDPAIPCHRVIRSDGKLGGYNRGIEAKRRLLRQEGNIIS